MNIRFCEKDGIGNFIIDDKRMEHIKSYEIKRYIENEIDTVDVTLTISILAKDFETLEEITE